MRPLFSLCALLWMGSTVLAACGQPQTVEVTRVAQQTVEVTRIVPQTVVVEKIVTPTPRPTPRPTATPKAPEVGTRQKPYPLGATVGLIQGDKLEFEFTVLETVSGDEAFSRVKQANQFNDAPPAGHEFILVHVKVHYAGKDQGVLSIDKFDTAVLSKGRFVSYLDMRNTPCCIEPEFDFELFQGAEAEGWLGVTVSMDDPNPLLILGGQEGIFFQLQPQE